MASDVNMFSSEFPEWETIVQELSKVEGVILILGTSNSGKFLLARDIAKAALNYGETISIVDADPATAEIGPICCMATGRIQADQSSLTQIKPDEVCFAGNVSVSYNPALYVSQVNQLVNVSRSIPSKTVVIASSDFLRGANAVNLNQSLIETIRPDAILALQRNSEIDRITSLYHNVPEMKTINALVPFGLRTSINTQNRERQILQFNRLFDTSELFELPMEKLRFAGTWMGQAEMVPPHILKFISTTLGTSAYYAEIDNGHLGVVIGSAKPKENGLTSLQEQLRYKEITLTPAKQLKHLLVGLLDQHGRFLSVGKIDSIDFRARILRVRTALRTSSAVRILRFGTVQVDVKGKIVGALHLGDV